MGDRELLLKKKGSLLSFGKQLVMPLHTPGDLPVSLRKKGAARSHVILTRRQGQLSLFLDGFPASGTISAPGVFKMFRTDQKGALFSAVTSSTRSVNSAEARSLFRTRWRTDGKTERLNVSADWENALRSGKVNSAALGIKPE